MDEAGAGRPRRRSGIVLAALVAAGVAMLVGLGTWQIDRLQSKRGLIAARLAAVEAPAVDIVRPDDGGSLPEFRRVRVRGAFLHDRELLVGPRSRDATAGWGVVTPLALAAGGHVLVDRGFVPEALKRPSARVAGQIAGPVVVEGLLRRPSPPGPFTPADVPEKGVWFRIGPAAMEKALGLEDVAPFWVAAGPAANPGGWPVGGADIVMPRNDHLQYAITWYALAVALLAVYAAFLRRQRSGAP